MRKTKEVKIRFKTLTQANSTNKIINIWNKNILLPIINKSKTLKINNNPFRIKFFGINDVF